MSKKIQRGSQKAKKRLAFLVVVCAATLLAYFSAMPLLENVAEEVSMGMRIENIQAEEVGRSNLSAMVTPEMIVRACGIRRGQEILKADLKEAETKLMQIPWLKEVRLRKVLPSSIDVEYSVHQARAIVVRKRVPWLISENGKFIAPTRDFKPIIPVAEGSTELSAQVSAVSKDVGTVSESEWAQGLDLPIVVNEGYLVDELRWLETLERDLASVALSIHEIDSDGTSVSAIMEINYKTHPAKIYLKAWSQVQPSSIDKLKKVIDYLVANRIAVVSVDLRPGKKVIVNTRKRP